MIDLTHIYFLPKTKVRRRIHDRRRTHHPVNIEEAFLKPNHQCPYSGLDYTTLEYLSFLTYLCDGQIWRVWWVVDHDRPSVGGADRDARRNYRLNVVRILHRLGLFSRRTIECIRCAGAERTLLLILLSKSFDH